MQRRARQSPFKDIAEAHSKGEVLDWLKEDGHKPNTEGGSVADALRHTMRVYHHVHRRDLMEHHRGGSISGLVGDAGHYLSRGHDVLESFAGTTLAQGDILADNALDKLGIRKSRYSPLERNQDNQLHARLAQQVYMDHAHREMVNGWAYESGDDRHGVFKKGNQRIVAFRGTKPKDAIANIGDVSGDLEADRKIAMGETDSMHNLEADKQIVRDLLDKGYDTSLSGYSLGSGVALAIANDDDIYKRLGTNNHVIAPGISHMNPDIKKLATLDKFHYTYNAFDPVASSFLAHATDNHHVDKSLNATSHTDILGQLSKDLKTTQESQPTRT